jgi:thioesterase domain-containing protein
MISREGELPRLQCSDLELRLTEIIESVLGPSSLQSQEHLPALGTFPRSTVELLQSKLENAFGKRPSLIRLLQCSTLASLAALVSESTNEDAWGSIVPFETRGDLLPVFCVHGGGGEVDAYSEISRLLGCRQPFYAIQPRENAEFRAASVEQMASDYIESIKTVQATGPYCLAGYSLGGTIAFEMAQQLLATGEKVAAVVLLDTHFPGRRFGVPGFRFAGPVRRLDYYWGKVIVGPFEPKIWAKKLFAASTRWFGIAHEHLKPRHADLDSHWRAHFSYEPKPLRTRIVLFWASDCAFRAADDTRLVWSEVAELGLEVRHVAGNHLSMLKPPHAEMLAREIKKCLAAIDSGF